MIDIKKTFEMYGYYPNELSPSSHRPVLNTCEVCGKTRISEFRNSHVPMCQSCSASSDTVNAKKSESMSGRHFTEEHKNKISIALTGKTHSPEHCEHLSGKHNGMYGRCGELNPNWNGGGIDLICAMCGKTYHVNLARCDSKFCSPKCRIAFYVGENSPSWKGGATAANKQFYNSNDYKKWRISVFERDLYTCQECGSTSSSLLNAHHILPIRDWRDKQFSLNVMNGITLCGKCHKKTYYKEYDFFSKYFDIANGVEKLS